MAAGSYYENITLKDRVQVLGAGANNIGSEAKLDGFTIANGNSADYGGGVYLDNSSLTISNNIISSNNATDRGGGISCIYSSPSIINNIITGNSVSYEGAGIWSNNTSSASINYNDVWNNTPDNYYGCSAGVNDLSQDPLFVNPTNSDYHLQPTSPCIDAGDNTVVPSWVTIDFEADPRIVDGDGDSVAVVDVGADEYLPPPDIRTPFASIDFADVAVGRSANKTTTIYNDGGASLTTRSITRGSGSDEFTYVSPLTPFEIGGGASRAIIIMFAPTSEGLKSATFSVNSSDPDEPNATFGVSGDGFILPGDANEDGNLNALDITKVELITARLD